MCICGKWDPERLRWFPPSFRVNQHQNLDWDSGLSDFQSNVDSSIVNKYVWVLRTCPASNKYCLSVYYYCYFAVFSVIILIYREQTLKADWDWISEISCQSFWASYVSALIENNSRSYLMGSWKFFFFFLICRALEAVPESKW